MSFVVQGGTQTINQKKRQLRDEEDDPSVVNARIIEEQNCLPVYQVIGHVFGPFRGCQEKACRFIFDERPPILLKKENLEVLEDDDDDNNSTTIDDMPNLHDIEKQNGESPPNKKQKSDQGTPKTTTTKSKQHHVIDHLSEIAIFMGDFQFPLPTESPLVQYTLLVRQKLSNQTFEVVEVISTKLMHKNVTKNILKDYCTCAWGYSNESFLKKQLRSLPSDHLTSDDIERHVVDKKLASLLSMIVQVAEKPAPFFFLLKYFSATVLYKLTNWQLDYMASILETQPYVFCFRTLLEKVIQLPQSPFGDQSGLERWKIVPTYGLKRPDLVKFANISFRDRLTWQPTKKCLFIPTYFNPRQPLLPFHQANELYIRAMPQPPIHIASPETLRRAMEYYIELDGKRYSLGSTVNYLSNMPQDVKDLLVRDLQILIEVENNKFMLEEDDHLERVFADTFSAFVSNVKTFESRWYNATYCRSLAEWINKDQDLRQTAFLYTHSFSWSTFLTTHSKMEFSCVKRRSLSLQERISRQVMIQETKKRVTPSTVKQTFVIIVEHVHKFSTENFICLMWDAIDSLMNRRSISSECISLDLVLIGDSEDLPVYHLVGTGDLWKDITYAYPSTNLGFPNGVSQNILEIKNSLTSKLRTGINVQSKQVMSKLTKAILGVKRKLNNPKKNDLLSLDEKGKRSTKKRKTTQILCSAMQEQRVLSEALDDSRIDDYKDNVFCVGNHVGVRETGSDGIIKKIYRIETDDTQTDLGKQRGAELHFGTWKFKICPCLLSSRCKCAAYYPSSRFTIYHNYVDIVQRRQGIPTDYVIFYVSKSTKLSHLIAALKYCTEEFHVFILSDTQFVSIYEDRNRRDFPRISTLSNRLIENTYK